MTRAQLVAAYRDAPDREAAEALRREIARLDDELRTARARPWCPRGHRPVRVVEERLRAAAGERDR